MTTAPERPAIRRRPDWADRSLLPSRAGAQWWVAVCVALVLTTVGVFADIQRLHQLGIVFQACYFLGCLLAVVVVQRKSLFGPMVQPPLILAITVPSVVLLANSVHTKGGVTAAALAVGTPLINGFPTMAVTTVLVLAVGIYRLATQRTPAASRPETSRPQTARPKTSRPKTSRPQTGERTSDPDRRAPADQTRQQADGPDRRAPADRTRQQAGRPRRRPATDPTARQPAPRPARQEDQRGRRGGAGPASEPVRRTGEQPPPDGERVRRRPPRG